MAVIKLKYPKYALDLMLQKTPMQAYNDMLKNKGLPFKELVTFGGIITPIVETETGIEHHHVSYWENGMVSVTQYNLGEEFLPLVGIENWGKKSPNCDEALEIFYRHVAVT